MANALYLQYKIDLIEADADVIASNVKFVFTDHADVTPLPATHDFLDDIAAGTVATSGNLSGKSAAGGKFDAADETVNAVSGDPFESINIFIDTGSAPTSNLCVFIDTATGLPCTPNSGSIQIVWHSSGIYSL